jgi:hypothetical protein
MLSYRPDHRVLPAQSCRIPGKTRRGILAKRQYGHRGAENSQPAIAGHLTSALDCAHPEEGTLLIERREWIFAIHVDERHEKLARTRCLTSAARCLCSHSNSQNTRFRLSKNPLRFAANPSALYLQLSAKPLPAKRLNLPLHPAAGNAWLALRQRKSTQNPQSTSKNSAQNRFRPVTISGIS